MTIRNSTFWITGASSGIGEALALDLSRRGARLILSSRRTEALEDVRSRCARPDRHTVQPLDLADPDSLHAAADAVLDHHGAVDGLVNNGGISQRSLATETDLSVVRRILEVNFFGAVTLTQAVVPAMQAQGRGHLVVTSSLVGKFGTAMRSAYAASKHALHGYFDSLRAEVHDDGIRVTLVCPGFVQTNVGHNALTSDGQPLGEVTDVDEVGIPPARCADAIADAIEAERDEVYVGGWEVAGVYLKRLSPTLFNRLIRQMNV
jgi:short-subunit dehydrogenase